VTVTVNKGDFLKTTKGQILRLPLKDRKKILKVWIKWHNEHSDKDAKKTIKGEIKWLKKSIKGG